MGFYLPLHGHQNITNLKIEDVKWIFHANILILLSLWMYTCMYVILLFNFHTHDYYLCLKQFFSQQQVCCRETWVSANNSKQHWHFIWDEGLHQVHVSRIELNWSVMVAKWRHLRPHKDSQAGRNNKDSDANIILGNTNWPYSSGASPSEEVYPEEEELTSVPVVFN